MVGLIKPKFHFQTFSLTYSIFAYIQDSKSSQHHLTIIVDSLGLSLMA